MAFTMAPSLSPALATVLKAEQGAGWRRIIIEKPFGDSRITAVELDKEIHNVLKEEQIYRVDHFLGKETVRTCLYSGLPTRGFGMRRLTQNKNRESGFTKITCIITRNLDDFVGYPDSIYTIGSAFAVRAEAYMKQGGMNRRQAGEDFYFLYKLTKAWTGDRNQ